MLGELGEEVSVVVLDHWVLRGEEHCQVLVQAVVEQLVG